MDSICVSVSIGVDSESEQATAMNGSKKNKFLKKILPMKLQRVPNTRHFNGRVQNFV